VLQVDTSVSRLPGPQGRRGRAAALARPLPRADAAPTSRGRTEVPPQVRAAAAADLARAGL